LTHDHTLVNDVVKAAEKRQDEIEEMNEKFFELIEIVNERIGFMYEIEENITDDGNFKLIVQKNNLFVYEDYKKREGGHFYYSFGSSKLKPEIIEKSIPVLERFLKKQKQVHEMKGEKAYNITNKLDGILESL